MKYGLLNLTVSTHASLRKKGHTVYQFVLFRLGLEQTDQQNAADAVTRQKVASLHIDFTISAFNFTAMVRKGRHKKVEGKN